MKASKLSKEELTLVANCIRILSAEAVQNANSGHPGAPMGIADLGTVLWLNHLNINPRAPRWLNRDRFILSNGHASMFLYSMLHLSGFELSLEQIKSFRQLGSITPGHPEFSMTPGVECTTGPLGQGVSNAVGMALGERMLAAEYNSDDYSIINHNVVSIVGDGCLMEGVSSEASSLAGHLGLSNLIVIYDDNKISIEGSTDLAFSEDVAARYEAYGWRSISCNGHDYDSIDQAICEAKSEKEKPVLVLAKTIIGKGSPDKAGSHEVHGAPLGEDELQKTKEALGWPSEPAFYVPDEVRKIFAERNEEWQATYDTWIEHYQAWQAAEPEKAASFKKQTEREIPSDLKDRLLSVLPDGSAATRKLSGAVIQEASKLVNSFIGGSADLAPSTNTLVKGSSDISKESFSGRNLRFGVREHAMGAIMNGLSYYGAFLPYGATFLVFSDYMRPTLRLAALSHIPGIFIFTHDSVFLGEDGPTHQPIEHINSLRMIPNLWVMRPADGIETAVCYSMALARRDGPVAMCFTRQSLPVINKKEGFQSSEIEKGAYVAWESSSDAKPELILVATGSELSLAYEVALSLSKDKVVRVISMPCAEVYASQSEHYRKQLLPNSAKIVTIEAGSSYGWAQLVSDNDNLLHIGIDRFGASAPYKEIVKEFGFNVESIESKIRSKLL